MKRKLWRPLLIIALLLIAIAWGAAALARVPNATPFSDAINVTVKNPSGSVHINSLKMVPQIDRSLRSFFGKSYNSPMKVEVANDSSSEAYLGLYTYANSGRVGLYSPGACAWTEVIAVPPHWSGTQEFSVRHLRFAYGGSLQIQLGVCRTPRNPNGIFLPDDATVVFEKTYPLVKE